MTEEEIIKKAEEINEMNDHRILLEALKKFSLKPNLVNNVSCNANILPEHTMGGKVWYDNIAEFAGWKWQKNKVFGFLRVIDTMDNCKAWGDYQKMVDLCKNFLIQELNHN